MPLETATYISDLVPTNPLISDNIADGPSHFWLIKKVLQSTFPNIKGAVTATQDQLNTLTGLVGSSTSDGLDIQGSLTVSDGVDLKGSLTVEGTTLVPSVTDWTSKQAVSASDADGRYVKSVDDGTNIRIDSAGINKQTGVAWVHTGSGFTNLQAAGDYATNTALNNEATTRADADADLNNSKANLSGGNSFTGDQSVSGSVIASSHNGSDAHGGLRWGGYLNGNISGYTYNNYNLYMCEIVGSDPYVDLQVNFSGTNAIGGSGRTDFTFHGISGRIGTILGDCAVMSDLSNYVPMSTYNSDFSTSDSRIINLAYSHKIQVFTATVSGSSQTVTFPEAFSSTNDLVVLASCSLQPGATNRAGLVNVNSWDASSCNVTTFFTDSSDLSFASSGLPCYFIAIGPK